MKTIWFKALAETEMPADTGVAIKYEQAQIALFYFSKEKRWFATQNLCPHQQQMVLGRGMLGDLAGKLKVTCPMHKKNFALETGQCFDDPELSIQTFAVKIEDGFIFINLPEDENYIAGKKVSSKVSC